MGRLLFELEPRLVATALRITRNRESASDVVQTAFEKALRKGRRQFRGDSLLSTWMHRIVVNEALMWLRSERRRSDRIQSTPDLDALDPEAPDPALDSALATRQETARVRLALAQLRPEDRDVLVRCGLGDESYGEYAHARGLHPAAVKSRAFRARQLLRAILERERRPAA